MDDNAPHESLEARLDALRDLLRKIRDEEAEAHCLDALGFAEGELDAHLATLDDACEALQAGEDATPLLDGGWIASGIAHPTPGLWASRKPKP